jgi:hypothetical protein
LAKRYRRETRPRAIRGRDSFMDTLRHRSVI